MDSKDGSDWVDTKADLSPLLDAQVILLVVLCSGSYDSEDASSLEALNMLKVNKQK